MLVGFDFFNSDFDKGIIAQWEQRSDQQKLHWPPQLAHVIFHLSSVLVFKSSGITTIHVRVREQEENYRKKKKRIERARHGK